MRSEHSWSLIDPRPVMLYLNNLDEYIIYWNGVVMPHSMALCMSMEHCGIYATPEMKSALESNYRKIYYTNGFQTRAWDQKVESGSVYPYLKRIMTDHLKKALEDKEPQEILGWFNYNRSRKEVSNG